MSVKLRPPFEADDRGDTESHVDGGALAEMRSHHLGDHEVELSSMIAAERGYR